MLSHLFDCSSWCKHDIQLATGVEGQCVQWSKDSAYNGMLVWWWYIGCSSKCGCQCAICLTHTPYNHAQCTQSFACSQCFIFRAVTVYDACVHTTTGHARKLSQMQQYTCQCYCMSWKETLVVTCTSFSNYTAWKWQLEKKNQDLAPEFTAYALTRSFSYANH